MAEASPIKTRKRGERRESRPAGRPPPRHTRLLMAIAAGALAVVVVALAVYVLGGDGGDGGEDGIPRAGRAPGNGRQAAPPIYTPESGDQTPRLARRSVDSRTLTKDEIFTPETKVVTYKQYSFTLAAAEVSNDCRAVSWGARMQGDLQKYGCTQVARGAYISNDRRYHGQFIAINLNDSKGATAIAGTLGVGKSAGFIYPLAVPGAERFGTGLSGAYSQVHGHYTIVAWVQRAGGAQPANVTELLNLSLAVIKPGDFVWARDNLLDPGH